MARAEGIAALEAFNSGVFVAVSGIYFDAQRVSSNTLLSVLDAELSSGNLPALLDKVLRLTTDAFNANVGIVLLRDDGDDCLRPQAVVGIDLDDALEVPVGFGFTARLPRPASLESSPTLNIHREL